MNFENRPTHSLRPYAGNARTHSPKQIKQISRSIERFGFNNPKPAMWRRTRTFCEFQSLANARASRQSAYETTK